MSSSTSAVATLSRSLESLKDRIDTLQSEHYPLVDKLKRHIQLLEKELILEAPPNGDLSVTAQILIEQFIGKAMAQLSAATAAHRGMHGSVRQVGKDIEQKFVGNLGGLLKNEKNVEKDPRAARLVNGMICDYLMSSGHPEIAETLVKECSLNGRIDDYLKRKAEVDQIMNAFREKDIFPAVDYIDKFAQRESRLKFDIMKQYMIKLIEDGDKLKAIQFSKKLVGLGADDELAHLMGALLGGPRDPRYVALFSPLSWKSLESRLAAILLRTESNLTQILETGLVTVPALLNLKSIMVNRSDALSSSDELPIEVKVPEHIHSTFTCPILKQQATDSNPPMRLACGHVISRDALNKLAQSNRHFRLKCPYCPEESALSDAKRVYF